MLSSLALDLSVARSDENRFLNLNQKRTIEGLSTNCEKKVSTFDSADLRKLFADVEHTTKRPSTIIMRDESFLHNQSSPPSKKRRVMPSNSISHDNLKDLRCGVPRSSLSNDSSITRVAISRHPVTVGEELPAIVSRSFSAEKIPFTAVEHPAQDHSKDVDFGWYVDMDTGDHDGFCVDPYSNGTSSLSLAFSAQVAPNAPEQHSAVEWAKAADVVDEVLGDFF